MPTLEVWAGLLMAAVGEMMGKALKVKGNAERDDRRGGDSLDVDEGTKAGCRTVVGAAVVEGTLMGPCSEWGVVQPLRLPGMWVSTDEDELEEEAGDEADVDVRGFWGLLVVLRGSVARGAPCWCCRKSGWVRWAGGDPKAEPQARWLSPE